MKLSWETLLILRTMLDAEQNLAGSDLTRRTDLGSGTVYPILRRLTDAGWVAKIPEDVDPVAVGRPRRNFYEFTSVGRREACARLNRLGRAA